MDTSLLNLEYFENRSENGSGKSFKECNDVLLDEPLWLKKQQGKHQQRLQHPSKGWFNRSDLRWEL